MNMVQQQQSPPTVEAGTATAVTAAPYVPRARIIAAPGGSIAGRRDYEEARTSPIHTGTTSRRRRSSSSSLTRPSCSPSLPRVASLTTPINKTMGDIDLSSSSSKAAVASTSSSPEPEPVISHQSAAVMDDRAHTLRNAARAAAGLPPVEPSTPPFVPYTGRTTATTTSPSPTWHPARTHGTRNNTTKIQDPKKKAAMRDLVRNIHPTEYVRAAFTANGFPVEPHQVQMIKACTRRLVAHAPPTTQQLHEYHDPEAHLVQVIRTNNVRQARHLYHAGKLTVNACNPFGESILHLACRRGLYEMVQFLVEEVGIALDTQRDDYHRTVLHDVLWSASDFDTTANLVKYLLLTCASTAALLLVEDVRGYTPFDYARAEHRGKWLHFLWEHRTWLWPPPPEGTNDDDDAPTTETPTHPSTKIATRTAAVAAVPTSPVHKLATAALAVIETEASQQQLPPAKAKTVATGAGTAAAVAATSSTVLFPKNQPYRSSTEEEDYESASSDEEYSSAESQSEDDKEQKDVDDDDILQRKERKRDRHSNSSPHIIANDHN